MQSYLRVLAKQNAPISFPSWPKVSKELKEKIWEQAQVRKYDYFVYLFITLGFEEEKKIVCLCVFFQKFDEPVLLEFVSSNFIFNCKKLVDDLVFLCLFSLTIFFR